MTLGGTEELVVGASGVVCVRVCDMRFQSTTGYRGAYSADSVPCTQSAPSYDTQLITSAHRSPFLGALATASSQMPAL